MIKKGSSSTTIYLDCHIVFTLWSLRASSKLFSKSHIDGDASHARSAFILHLDCAIRRLGAVEVVQHNVHGVHSPSHPISLSPPQPVWPGPPAGQPGRTSAYKSSGWGPYFEIGRQPYFQNRVVVSKIYTQIGAGPSGACCFFCLATRKRGAQRAKFQTAYKKSAYKSQERVPDLKYGATEI